MTNYDILKEYEARQTPVPSYDSWQKHKKVTAETQIKNCDLEIINAQLKKLLKEIRGKLHYINTPKNTHNVFSNDLAKRIDEVLK